MAIGQRLYTRRLCLLPHPQRNREGRLQLGRLPEGARVPGHYALASRVAANPEASGALERNDVAGANPARCIKCSWPFAAHAPACAAIASWVIFFRPSSTWNL